MRPIDAWVNTEAIARRSRSLLPDELKPKVLSDTGPVVLEIAKTLKSKSKEALQFGKEVERLLTRL